MNIHRRRFALMTSTVLWLATRTLQAAAQASAPGTPGAHPPVDDLSALRAIAVDAQKLARGGDLAHARARVENLEVEWRQAKSRMRSLSPQKRQAIDTALDRVERELRFWRARRTDSAEALQSLVDVMDE
jgi:hypothetical protein